MSNIIEKSSIIVLRTTEEKDLEFVVNAEGNPINAQYVTVWSREQHKNALLEKDILHLIVEDSITNKPVGYVIIAGIKNPSKNIEFRRIVISDKGKGRGRETLRLIKKIAFNRLGAHRLWLDVRCKNLKAKSLYKSEGFVEEGILRECVFYNGEYESLIIMSILKEEYEGFTC